MTTLFNRAGKSFEVIVREGVKPMRGFTPICGRCGGAGGADKWAHTGWTCFQCRGSGNGAPKAEPLYTREQLDTLITRKAKADATRLAKAAAKREAEEARREAERAALVALEKLFLDRIAYVVDTTDDSFPAQIWRRIVREVRPISEAQRAAVLDRLVELEAEKARRRAAQHIGTIGERRMFDLTFVRDMFFDNDFGGSFLTIARDDAGNTIIYWGSWNAFGFPTHRTAEDGRQIVPGSKATVKATIKDHRSNKKTGEPETVVNRPAKIKEAA